MENSVHLKGLPITGCSFNEGQRFIEDPSNQGDIPKSIVAIYEYTGDEEEPFKLAANFAFDMVGVTEQ